MKCTFKGSIHTNKFSCLRLQSLKVLFKQVFRFQFQFFPAKEVPVNGILFVVLTASLLKDYISKNSGDVPVVMVGAHATEPPAFMTGFLPRTFLLHAYPSPSN